MAGSVWSRALTALSRFINLAILAVMATVCGIVDAVLEQRNYPRGAPWLFGDDQGNDNPHINGLITFAFALITYGPLVVAERH